MDTNIGYLRKIEDDLRDAAERERHLAPARKGRRRRGGPWIGIAAGVVAFLVVAGLVGSLMKSQNQVPLTASSGTAAPGNAFAGREGALAPAALPDFGVAQQSVGAAGAGGAAQPLFANQPAAQLPHIDLSKIIRTGSLRLTVPRDGLGGAVDRVTAIADTHGGFVFSSSVGVRAGNLVLHVPAARFDATVTALRQVGEVTSVQVAAEDVTAQFVDLRARLKILEGRRRALQALYAKAVTIDETLRVQNALDDTQGQIEQIQGQLNVIQSRTSESSIRVSLLEAGVPQTPQDRVRNPSIGEAWARAVAGFFGVVATVVVGLGYLVPLSVLALLFWFVAALVRRRRRTARAS